MAAETGRKEVTMSDFTWADLTRAERVRDYSARCAVCDKRTDGNITDNSGQLAFCSDLCGDNEAAISDLIERLTDSIERHEDEARIAQDCADDARKERAKLWRYFNELAAANDLKRSQS